MLPMVGNITLGTAAALFAQLKSFGPTTKDGELVFTIDPPENLDSVLRILHTGVRALLTGRRWFGCGSERVMAAPRPLNPAMPIPAGITLLCVEGDQCWDRIHPAAWNDYPHLFAKETKTARNS
jgi:hypothetical protein